MRTLLLVLVVLGVVFVGAAETATSLFVGLECRAQGGVGINLSNPPNGDIAQDCQVTLEP